MVEGLEKRRGIRPGTQVLATRGPPTARRVGNEEQNQAWDSGFGNTRAAKCWKGWKRGAELGPGVRFWQHEGRQVLEGLGKEAQNQARE